MITDVQKNSSTEFYLIHPLDDVQEQKFTGEGLGKMAMTKSVRISLILLRVYLLLMFLLVICHVVDIAKALPHAGSN